MPSLRWPRRVPKIVTIAGVAVAIGLLPMPPEYYALVRLFFCGVSLYYLSRPTGVSDAGKWLLVGLVILHNPVVTIELGDRRVWAIVNFATWGYFWIVERRTMRRSRW